MSPRPHNRRRVDAYLRESLCIHKSVKALALCCSVTWDGVVKFRNRVRDESSLWSWYTYLEARKDEILKATAVELSATVVVQITKRRPPRGGKHAEDDKNFKDLKTAVLGDKPGHNAEGLWREANALSLPQAMARSMVMQSSPPSESLLMSE